MNNLEGHSVDHELLGKYLSGECLPEEQAQVEEWLSDPVNAAEFELLQSFWEGAEVEVPLVNTEAAWESVRSRTLDQPERPVRGKSLRRRATWAAVVAALIVVAGVALRVFQPGEPQEPIQVVYTNFGQVAREYQLPDGSLASVAGGSRISFATDFEGELREVELEGEAFFEVEKNPGKPFVVRSDGSEARVLGTAFSVSTYRGFEVKVEEGKVKLSAPVPVDKPAASIVLTAGMKARVDPQQKDIVDVGKVEANAFAWKTHRLVYEAMPLGTVATDLRDFFGADVRFSNESLKDCLLNATFFQDDIHSILEVISESFNLKVTQDGDSTFTLSGEGC